MKRDSLKLVSIKFISFIITAGLLLMPALLFAQDNPGGGSGDDCDPLNDPDGCPLDTWVWVLAIIALIAGVIYLQRQKRAAYKQ